MARRLSLGRRRAARLAAALVLAAASGCVRGTVPATELYRITPQPVALDGADSGAAGPLVGSIGVTPYVTPGVYGGRNIVFRVDQHGYGTYAYREWAIPLADMLGTLTQERLRRSPLTSGPALYDPSAATAVEYLWRGTVREFEEADRGRDVFAAVALEVQIVRAADNAIIWSGARRAERQVQDSRSMSAIVGTLATLATEVVDELIREGSAALRALPPQSAPASPATP